MPHRPILVVDDDTHYRDYLVQVLDRLGVGARALASGRAALAQFRRRHVAAIITDIVMPDMDGIELIRAVRRRSASLPILAITAYDAPVADIYLKAATAVGATFVGRKGGDDAALLRDLLAAVDFRRRLARDPPAWQDRPD
jgi:CheY-like chemotaxis protein